jgi:hypothetical protein
MQLISLHVELSQSSSPCMQNDDAIEFLFEFEF